jgi:hypothetical protein
MEEKKQMCFYIPCFFFAAMASRVAKLVSDQAAGVRARVTAIMGSQWGDEGKGKLADVLAKKCV